MEIEKLHVRNDNCSCNFCDKGELNINKNGLKYPYEYVYEFSREKRSGLRACICEDCLNELRDFAITN